MEAKAAVEEAHREMDRLRRDYQVWNMCGVWNMCEGRGGTDQQLQCTYPLRKGEISHSYTKISMLSSLSCAARPVVNGGLSTYYPRLAVQDQVRGLQRELENRDERIRRLEVRGGASLMGGGGLILQRVHPPHLKRTLMAWGGCLGGR